VDKVTTQPERDPRAIERAKQQVRDRIWALLERKNAAEPPGRVVGKIPNFLGAEAAADRLATLPAWQAARVVKANPDKAQRPVRARALTEGKVLYMAVPRLADELPFYLLDPQHLSMSPWEAASKEGAAKAGRKVAARELPSVDLVICGSVAVNRQGARIGKGGGFSDLEVAFLVEAGMIRPDTVLATTVHPLQVVNEPLPETVHDFRVDLIVTPDEAIWCAEPHRPPGILWEHLDPDKIAEVPALAALTARAETPRQSVEWSRVVPTFYSHFKAGPAGGLAPGAPRWPQRSHPHPSRKVIRQVRRESAGDATWTRQAHLSQTVRILLRAICIRFDIRGGSDVD
jgi:5-formyltetrahydrofolate cyclo-ligase